MLPAFTAASEGNLPKELTFVDHTHVFGGASRLWGHDRWLMVSVAIVINEG